MSYYREEHPADLGDIRPIIPYVHREDVWVTGKGEEIPYSELTTPHILNILNLIGRNMDLKTKASREEKLKTRSRLFEELKRRKK